jgi:pyruvate formate lyase activating enzyme
VHCLRCGACAAACPPAAIDLQAASRIDRARCDRCGQCVPACPGTALRLIGTYWPAEKLARLLMRDAPFYRHSGGGVTLSGGECTMFPDYLESLLRILKARNIHVVLETCGWFEYDTFARQILPYLDLVFFDVKIMDPQASLKYLGRSSEKMLDNLGRLLREASVEVRPRIPLIPSITDSRDNLAATVACLRRLGARSICPLPYNPLGLAMYARLGRPTPDLPPGFPKPERERELIQTFRGIAEAS